MFENLSIPTGPSSCAEATTAKEAAFRIDYPLPAARNTRIIALDSEAEAIVRAASELEWGEARFYATRNPGSDLVTMDGQSVALEGEIAESNTLVMVSVTGENAAAMAHFGEVCYNRGIMTAGLAMTPGDLDSDALHNLRPHARVLLVPAEPEDLLELLWATRA